MEQTKTGATLALPAISLWRLTIKLCGGGGASLRDLGTQRWCRRGGGVAVAGLRPCSASPSLHQSLRSCGFSFCRCGPRGQGYVPKAGGEEPAWQRQPESRGRAQAGRAGGAPGPGQGAAEPAGAWRRRLRRGVCELRQPAAGPGAEAAGGAGGRVRRARERERRRRGASWAWRPSPALVHPFIQAAQSASGSVVIEGPAAGKLARPLPSRRSSNLKLP